MSSSKDTFQTALRQSDFKSLEEHLKASTEISELRQILSHHNPRIVHTGLLFMESNWEQVRNPHLLGQWASLLPTELSAFYDELQLLLANMYTNLWHWREDKTLPLWKEANLQPAVALRWLNAQICTTPKTISNFPQTETFFQALLSIQPEQLFDPTAFFTELILLKNQTTGNIAIRLSKKCLLAKVITPEFTQKCILSLASSEYSQVAYQAFGVLGEPWALMLDVPDSVYSKGLDSEDLSVRKAMVQLLGSKRKAEQLYAILRNDSLDTNLRRDAMSAFGEFLEAKHLSVLLEITLQDPLCYGDTCIEILNTAHRRGIFIQGEHLNLVLELFARLRNFDAENFSSLCYTLRKGLISQLSELAVDDSKWFRFLELLEHNPEQETLPLLIRIIKETKNSGIRRLTLRILSRFTLSASGAKLRDADFVSLESIVLEYLASETLVCLEVLQVLGGERTITILTHVLKIKPENSFSDSLPLPELESTLKPFYHKVLLLLWRLISEHSSLRNEILENVPTAHLPPGIIKDIGRLPSSLELKSLLLSQRSNFAHEDILSLCRLGGAESIDDVQKLFKQHVLAISQERVYNEHEYGDARFQVYSSVKDAIKQMGERLFERGRIRPRCLLAAEDQEQAGSGLLAEIILHEIDARPTDAELVILLKALFDVKYPLTKLRVLHLVRRKEPQVRKVVIELLSLHNAFELSFSIAKLTREHDIETVRQGILALSNFNGKWASSWVVACLDHPNMNIKKTAAESLARIGQPDATERILFWLGNHDNPGLRSLLIQALDAVIGEMATATLVAAFAGSLGPHNAGQSKIEYSKKQQLLALCLDNRLTIKEMRYLLKSEASIQKALIPFILDGQVNLRDGTLTNLLAEIRMHGPLDAFRISKNTPDSKIQPTSDSPTFEQMSYEDFILLNQKPSSRSGLWIITHLNDFLGKLSGLLAQKTGNDKGKLSLPASLFGAIRLSEWQEENLRILEKHIPLLIQLLPQMQADQLSIENLCLLIEKITGRLPQIQVMGVTEQLRTLSSIPARKGLFRYNMHIKANSLITAKDVHNFIDDCRSAGKNPDSGLESLLTKIFQLSSPGPLLDEQYLDETADLPDIRLEKQIKDAVSHGEEALANLKQSTKSTVNTRKMLRTLVLVFSKTNPEHQDFLLEWMFELQPPGTPVWTIDEQIKSSDVRRKLRNERLLQHSSTIPALETLYTQLKTEGKVIRIEAAKQLLEQCAQPNDVLPVLLAFLEGEIPAPANLKLLAANYWKLKEKININSILKEEPEKQIRILKLWKSHLEFNIDSVSELSPMLIELWENASEKVSRQAEDVLRSIPPNHLVQIVLEAVQSEKPGFANLLSRPLPSSPEAAQLLELLNLKAEPSLETEDVQSLYSSQAMNALMESEDTAPMKPEIGIVETAMESQNPRHALLELLKHKNLKVRSRAHRKLRRLLPGKSYLEATVSFLKDPRPDVRRSAIRTLTHAEFIAGIPHIIPLLFDNSPKIQSEARSALKLFGSDALNHLKHALNKTRPDRRKTISDLMDEIREDEFS